MDSAYKSEARSRKCRGASSISKCSIWLRSSNFAYDESRYYDSLEFPRELDARLKRRRQATLFNYNNNSSSSKNRNNNNNNNNIGFNGSMDNDSFDEAEKEVRLAEFSAENKNNCSLPPSDEIPSNQSNLSQPTSKSWNSSDKKGSKAWLETVQAEDYSFNARDQPIPPRSIRTFFTPLNVFKISVAVVCTAVWYANWCP